MRPPRRGRPSRPAWFAWPVALLLAAQLLLPAGLFAHELLEHDHFHPVVDADEAAADAQEARLDAQAAKAGLPPVRHHHHHHDGDDCGVCQTVGHQTLTSVPPAAVVDCGPVHATLIRLAPATVHVAPVPLDSAPPRAPPVA